jgi:hypothetical protein
VSADVSANYEENMGPCKRSNGTLRAFFSTREEAEAFAKDPKNWPVYKGDIAHQCGKCGRWHLSRCDWLVPNHQRFMKSVN